MPLHLSGWSDRIIGQIAYQLNESKISTLLKSPISHPINYLLHSILSISFLFSRHSESDFHLIKTFLNATKFSYLTLRYFVLSHTLLETILY